MKVAVFLVMFVFSSSLFLQSGRRAREIKAPVPVPAETSTPSPTPAKEEPPPVTAEKNEDYRCSEDGSLLRVVDKDDIGELVPVSYTHLTLPTKA